MATGTSPLSMSPSIVSAAGHLPALRSTFAIPMFPLPTLSTSTPKARPTSIPVGTEPRTYPHSTRKTAVTAQ